MRTTPQRSSTAPRPPIKAGAIERLYVYWFATAAFLLLVAVVVVVYTAGALRRQGGQTEALTQRLQGLEESVAGLQSTVTRLDARLARAEAAAKRAAAETPTPTVRTPVTPARQQSTTQPAAAARSEAALQAQLATVMSPHPATPLDVRDRAAAAAVLDAASENAAGATWSGATWARLAVLARLLGDGQAAEGFAVRARAEGGQLQTYLAVTARAMLASGLWEPALAAADRLDAQTDGAPTARVLLAAALLGSGNLVAADEVLDGLTGLDELHAYDRLLLARAFMGLEHGEQVGAALAGIGEVPAELVPQRNFLEAVARVRRGQTVAALAILDHLAAQLPQLAAQAAEQEPGPWPFPLPGRYEVEVWRGVALMYAGQTEAAREVLVQAAELDNAQPEAFYYLGLLAIRAGRPAEGEAHLNDAIARSARMAAAWEALAGLAMNAGEVETALQHIDRVLQINVRRPSAHFLAAVALAKRSDRDKAAEALQATFRLDRQYVLKAKETDVLLRLFTPGEIDDLAAGNGAEETLPETPEAVEGT